MARVSIEVVGDTVSARAALDKLLVTTERLGDVYTGEFAKMEKSTLALQVAQGNLAVSTARYSAGSLGAARATLTYRNQLERLDAAQLAASKRQDAAVSKIGQGLTRYVTAPTLVAAAAAVKLGTDFQSHMLLIETQAGASAEEVAHLSGEVLKLASSGAQQGPVKLADALYHLESVGLRGSDAMRALRVSSDAAAVGMASIEDVASALGGAVTSNIRGTQDYRQAIGTLNATIGAGNMRMEDLIAALGTGVLPAAKNAGVSLTEVGAALATMTDRGMTADMAGTRLRMTFALMQAPSKQATGALADMGVNANVMAETLRKPDGLLKVLEMLHAGMKSVGAVRGSKDILGAFGGGRSGAGILTLIQSLDSGVSSYQAKVAQIQSTSGNLAKSIAVQQKSASANFHRDFASMEADLTKLGTSMLPTVTAIANGINAIGDAFGRLPGPIKTDLASIVALLAIGGPLLLGIVGVKRMIATIGTEFGLMPIKAAPGIAATEAEIAGIGASAAVAEAEVATLSASLLALETLGIVVPIVLAFTYRKQISNAITDATNFVTDHLHISGKGTGLPTYDQWSHSKGAERSSIEAVMKSYGITSPDQLPGAPRSPGAVDPEAAAKAAAGKAKSRAAAQAAPPPVPSTGKAVPLTAQQKLQDQLIAHPNDVRLLAQQARSDRSVIAWAERMRSSGRMGNAKFQEIYKQYMSDLVATEAHITELTRKAGASQQSEARKRVAATERAYRAMVADAKAAVDRAKLTRGTIKDDEVALAHLIAVYGREGHDRRLPADRRASALQDQSAARVTLSNLRDHFSVPLALQLEAAKGEATNNMSMMMDAAKKTKAAALRAIHSGVLSMQGMIDAWNVVAQANQTLGSGMAVTSYRAADVIKMTAGLNLSAAARRALEMRYAQALAHHGRVPTGPAAAGIPIDVHSTHHITVEIDGHKIAKKVTKHQQRARGRVADQVVGR